MAHAGDRRVVAARRAFSHASVVDADGGAMWNARKQVQVVSGAYHRFFVADTSAHASIELHEAPNELIAKYPCAVT